MNHDICNSPVSLETRQALDDWNAMVLAFLAHGTETPARLGAVLKAEPGFAMGYAAKGLFSLMMGRSELIDVARDAAQTARQAMRNGTTNLRERLWVDAVELWLDGKPSGTIAAMEQVLADFPQDTLSAKISHAIRFILGDGIGMRKSVERLLGAHGDDHPCKGYLLGCHAFTLEETGEYDLAERTGLNGLAFASDDAWGLHAVAHVYDMTARPDTGIRLIEDNTAAWDHCNNFRYHVWWHKALLHLDRGEFDRALALYDCEIRKEKTDDYRDIANATSLLMRLDLEAVETGDRWDELADLAEARIDDGCVVFADLHYMLALATAGRQDGCRALRDRNAKTAAMPDEMARRAADPGKAAMAGLHAFSEGRYDAAFADLLSARGTMQTVGGSHAQRDVFERITIDAGLRCGQDDLVEQVLRERLDRRGGHEDRFAASRFASLAEQRRIPAE